MKVAGVTRVVIVFATAAGLTVGVGTPTATAQTAPRYTVADLGTLGGESFALDINLQGQIVGTFFDSSGNQQAFLYAGGVMTPLGTLGGAYSYAYAINRFGDVAGDSETAGGLQHAYLRSAGVMTDLGTLGGGRSQANGINAGGQVVGWAYLVSGTYHGFLFENGTMTDITPTLDGWSIATDIDDLGRVVGYYQAVGGSRPFLWVADLFTDLGAPGGANKINLSGEIAGWSIHPDNTTHPVIYQGGTIVDLGSLGGTEGSAWGLNDLGQAVGYSVTGDGRWHAILYQGGALYDLNDLATANSKVELVAATAIDGLGRIVGFGCFRGQLTGRTCNGGQIRAVLLRPIGGQALQDLSELVGQLGLPTGTANSLLAKLDNANRCANRGNVACLCGSLTAFVNEVNAQSGKKLTDEQARLLLAAAQQLMAPLRCR